MYKKVFFYLLLFCLRSYAAPGIEMVAFSPQLFLENSRECIGIRSAYDRVVLTKECAAAQRSKRVERDVVGVADGDRKGFLITLSDHQTESYGTEYLENAILINSDTDREMENPFDKGEPYFQFGTSPGYIASATHRQVTLNKTRHPYVLTDFPDELLLPSGSPILDENGKIQCLLTYDLRCTTFKKESVLNKAWRNMKLWVKQDIQKYLRRHGMLVGQQAPASVDSSVLDEIAVAMLIWAMGTGFGLGI